MCGKSVVSPRARIEAKFAINSGAGLPDLNKRFVRPSMPIHILLASDSYEPVFDLKDATWGYDQGDIYNARIETVAELPMWKQDFNERRCVIPLERFHEGGKDFAMRSGEMVLAAGIYNTKNEVAMLTRSSDRTIVEPWHQRIPVILNSVDPKYDKTNLHYYLTSPAGHLTDKGLLLATGDSDLIQWHPSLITHS